MILSHLAKVALSVITVCVCINTVRPKKQRGRVQNWINDREKDS